MFTISSIAFYIIVHSLSEESEYFIVYSASEFFFGSVELQQFFPIAQIFILDILLWQKYFAQIHNCLQNKQHVAQRQ